MEPTNAELLYWAQAKVNAKKAEHARLSRQVDAALIERGEWQFLVARRAMEAKCIAVRHEHAVLVYVNDGDATGLRFLWESEHVDCRRVGSGLLNRQEEAVAS